MRCCRSSRLGAVLSSALVSLSWLVVAAARGQEMPPVPLAIGFAADSGEPVAMRVRDSGLLLRVPDVGWRLLCPAALHVSGNAGLFVTGLPRGRMLVGHHRGLQHGDDGYCSWSYPEPELQDRAIVDVRRQGTALWVLSTDAGRYTVHQSMDRGESFGELVELPGEEAYLSIAVAPSDARRMYALALGYDADAGEASRTLHRSDDGGESFSALPAQLEGEGAARLLGVDPIDPDRIYAAISRGMSSHQHGDEMHEADRVYGSADGGESWTLLRELSLFGGFGLGPGTGEVWLGDAEGGLLRSTDGGESFVVLDAEMFVSCIEVQDERVWICGDSQQGPEAFSLGYSEDGGESFTGVLRFDQVVGLLQCDGEDVQGCEAPWASFSFWHGIDGAPTASPDDGLHGAVATSMDAGASGMPNALGGDLVMTRVPEDGDGCGCRVALGAGHGPGLGAGVGLGFGLVLALAGRRLGGRRRRRE